MPKIVVPMDLGTANVVGPVVGSTPEIVVPMDYGTASVAEGASGAIDSIGNSFGPLIILGIVALIVLYLVIGIALIAATIMCILLIIDLLVQRKKNAAVLLICIPLPLLVLINLSFARECRDIFDCLGFAALIITPMVYIEIRPKLFPELVARRTPEEVERSLAKKYTIVAIFIASCFVFAIFCGIMSLFFDK